MREPKGRGRDALFLQVADRLGREIVAGTHPVGRPLPREADLAITHGVGRSAVREALKMLTAKGLIESRPRRGTLVRPSRAWNLFDPDLHAWLRDDRPDDRLLGELARVRRLIEPEAAALAAGRTAAELAGLRAAAERLRRPEPAGAGADVVTPVHEAILQASGNRFLAGLAPLVATAIAFGGGDAAALMPARLAVVAAILAGDAAAARMLMERLLDAGGPERSPGTGGSLRLMVGPAA